MPQSGSASTPVSPLTETPPSFQNLPWHTAPWTPAGFRESLMAPAPPQDRTCYFCGLVGHMRRQCWQEHPELHPAIRPWLAQQLARTNPRPTNQTAGVYVDVDTAAQQIADISSGTDQGELPQEHPFEFNMTMMETESDDSHTLVMSEVFLPDDRTLINGAVFEQPITDQDLCAELRPRVEPIRRWLLDSGASSHYVKEISRFRAYQWHNKPVQILTGKGPILGLTRGEVDVVVSVGRVVTGDVLLVPDLNVPSDLLSVSALMRSGLDVVFREGKAIIQK